MFEFEIGELELDTDDFIQELEKHIRQLDLLLSAEKTEVVREADNDVAG